jgi:hypothetical protein
MPGGYEMVAIGQVADVVAAERSLSAAGWQLAHSWISPPHQGIYVVPPLLGQRADRDSTRTSQPGGGNHGSMLYAARLMAL